MTTLDKQADLAGPGIGDYTELARVLPQDYRSAAHAARDDARAVRGEAGDRGDGSATELNLMQVQVPLIVDRLSGVNDYLDRDGSRTPVTFHIANDRDAASRSTARSCRRRRSGSGSRSGSSGAQPGEGILTDMRAVRKDYFLDHDHSAYVDQWDWEQAIRREDRTLDYLTETVRGIWRALKAAEAMLVERLAGARRSGSASGRADLPARRGHPRGVSGPAAQAAGDG